MTALTLQFKDFLRAIRRSLGLSPMQRVLRELRARGVKLESLCALEVFAGRGVFHTLDYAPCVAALEVWEIDPQVEARLRRNLPQATARIVDSHLEMRTTAERFDLVVIDNWMSTYDGHCEHFDLFPEVFRLAQDEAVFVVNVIPTGPASARRRFPFLFNDEQLRRRSAFYGTTQPDELSWETIVAAYIAHAETVGFVVDWHFIVRRHFLYYLALKIRRKTARSD